MYNCASAYFEGLHDVPEVHFAQFIPHFSNHPYIPMGRGGQKYYIGFFLILSLAL